MLQQTNGLRDRTCRIGIITRDHDRPNAGLTRPLERGANFRPGRVDHAYQPHKDQVPFQILRPHLLRIIRDILCHAVRQAQHTQRILCHLVVGSQDPLTRLCVQGSGTIVHFLVLCAELQDHIRRTFDGDHIPVLMLFICKWRGVFGSRRDDVVDGDHTLALGVEGHLVLTRIRFLDLHMHRACLCCRNE